MFYIMEIMFLLFIASPILIKRHKTIPERRAMREENLRATRRY